jgi:hypothetical protein
VTPAQHEFSREIDQGVEFGICHWLPGAHRCNDSGGHLEHTLCESDMGSSAIGALVDDAGGQEDQLPFRGTQCGSAIGGIQAYISLEQRWGIRESGEQIWNESEAFLHLF